MILGKVLHTYVLFMSFCSWLSVTIFLSVPLNKGSKSQTNTCHVVVQSDWGISCNHHRRSADIVIFAVSLPEFPLMQIPLCRKSRRAKYLPCGGLLFNNNVNFLPFPWYSNLTTISSSQSHHVSKHWPRDKQTDGINEPRCFWMSLFVLQAFP